MLSLVKCKRRSTHCWTKLKIKEKGVSSFFETPNFFVKITEKLLLKEYQKKVKDFLLNFRKNVGIM